jgi:hypothetical protein
MLCADLISIVCVMIYPPHFTVEISGCLIWRAYLIWLPSMSNFAVLIRISVWNLFIDSEIRDSQTDSLSPSTVIVVSTCLSACGSPNSTSILFKDISFCPR